MSLRFIYGRAGSGKSYYCFQDIKSRIDKNDLRPLILLVPEDYSFKAEKELLKFIGEKGLMKAKVVSFKRLAYNVFKEIGGLARQHMSNAGRDIMLYRIMDEHKDEFLAFKKAIKMKGFVNTISEMLTELKIYEVKPEDLELANEKIEDEALSKKLHDINLIYSEFEKQLVSGYIDTNDDLNILYEKLDSYAGLNNAEIWVDGFVMFTPQQYLIIEKLFKKADRINITIPCDISANFADKYDIFSSIREMEQRILKIAKDNNISYEKPVMLDCDVPYKYKDNPELAHLEKNLYAFPYRVYKNEVNSISIVKAQNRYNEVESAAQDIIRLCRDEGLRFFDIAVAAHDTDDYEKLIGAIFSEYGIPYFIDEKRDISSNPLIVLILSVFEILYKNWNYESVFNYLKTNLTGISMDDVDILENYVLSSGIKGSRWAENEWKYWPDRNFNGEMPEDAREKLKRINDIKQRVCSPILKFKKSLEDNSTAAQICASLFNFLLDIGIPERIEMLIDSFKNDGQINLASEYSKIWNIIIETLDQLSEVLCNMELTLEQFSKVLATGFEEYKIGLIPSAIDQVAFGSIERVKNYEVKALYILGVNDGIFPSVMGDEGILSDSDRECLESFGLKLAPGTRDKVFDEQYLVYKTLTKPDEYLKLYYPAADFEGKSLRPSIIISRIKKIFKNIKIKDSNIEDDSIDANLELVNTKFSTFNELICEMRKKADGFDVNPVWKDVYFWYINNDKWKEKTISAISGLHYVNQEKPVNPKKLRELYGKTYKFSISRLEKYAGCPFAYFIQYGLKAKERKIYELNPPDIGSFIHKILDSFSSYLDEHNIEWRNLEKDECENIISSIVNDVVDKMTGSILTSSSRYRYLKTRLQRIIIRAVWLIAIQIKHGEFNPVEHEVVFEDGGKYPPLSVKLPSGDEIKLIGRIDRVDKYENDDGIYVRIVDYKTGNKSFNLSDVYNGLELQLLIYLDAILEYAQKKGNKPVLPGGMMYFKVDDPIIAAKGEMTDDEIEEEIMKKLKLDGLILSDVKIVREMDSEISSTSLIIPAGIKNDGSFSSSSHVASKDDFDALRKHIKGKITALCEDMLKGNISISPYKKEKDTPCKYCSFKAVCRFDVSIKENSYRIIGKMTKDEIWKAIKNGGDKNGLDSGTEKCN
jgi:ATP-dependent helicase/nuclease subunit B